MSSASRPRRSGYAVVGDRVSHGKDMKLFIFDSFPKIKTFLYPIAVTALCCFVAIVSFAVGLNSKSKHQSILECKSPIHMVVLGASLTIGFDKQLKASLRYSATIVHSQRLQRGRTKRGKRFSRPKMDISAILLLRRSGLHSLYIINCIAWCVSHTCLESRLTIHIEWYSHGLLESS